VVEKLVFGFVVVCLQGGVENSLKVGGGGGGRHAGNLGYGDDVVGRAMGAASRRSH